MPELPEVETVRCALEKHLRGRVIKDINILYPSIFSYPDIKDVKEKIKNQKIIKVNRRGKWLVFVLDDYYLLSHLRMEGKYLYRKINTPYSKHEHVGFILDNKEELRYKDTRKFGRMYLVTEKELEKISPLKDLGCEPWDEKLTKEYLKEKLENKKIPIKTALLDQKIIVGIGNIYADEILFLSKINPLRKSNSLTLLELEQIIENTKKVLDEAIKLGGTTIHSYTSEENVTGNFQNKLYVHTRKNSPCLVCKTPIEKIKVGGRGTYFCSHCQK